MWAGVFYAEVGGAVINFSTVFNCLTCSYFDVNATKYKKFRSVNTQIDINIHQIPLRTVFDRGEVPALHKPPLCIYLRRPQNHTAPGESLIKPSYPWLVNKQEST